MVRTQIQLTEEQSRRLKRAAARMGISVAEVIRRSVDTVLAAEGLPDQEDIKARARAAFGAFEDSQPDVSEHHDHYLQQAFQQ